MAVYPQVPVPKMKELMTSIVAGTMCKDVEGLMITVAGLDTMGVAGTLLREQLIKEAFGLVD